MTRATFPRLARTVIGVFLVLSLVAVRSDISNAQAPTYLYPLKSSPDGRFLMDQNNQPVFIVGEDAWNLALQISDGDVETYLYDRSSRGFNAAWIGAISNVDQANAPYNYYGRKPFNGADFTNEDPEYWSHLDHVIDRAAAYGISLWISPAFVANEYQTSILNSSDAVMTAYGQFLGSRYKNFPNIVWVIGGDADPEFAGLYAKLDKLATGIRSQDTNHLITFAATRWSFVHNTQEPGGGYSSLDVWSPVPPWLDVNWVYQTGGTVISGADNNFFRSPFLPPLMGEDYYEGDADSFAKGVAWAPYNGDQARQEGWNEILSGAYVGRMFGMYTIVGFSSPAYTSVRWQDQLGSVGSVGQANMGALFQSREHWKLTPDTSHTVLTAGYQSGSALAVTARTSDGQTIIAYIPTRRQVTVDLSKINGTSARAWWFNPRTREATLIQTYPTTQRAQKLTPPDNNDWVLVIDDAAAALPIPGSGTVGSGDLNPPFVSITSPANGATVARKGAVTITAQASDDVGVSQVEFYVDGVLKCTDTQAPFACTWSVPHQPRTHTLEAKAYDTSANTSVSTITVTTN